MPDLSQRAYGVSTTAESWEVLWEASAYFERVAELMERAQEFVVCVGWQIDSRLSLRTGLQSDPRLSPRETLKNQVLRLCNTNPKLQFYFLIWDHSLFYVFERELWQGRVWDRIHPRVHFVFDGRHPWGGCHHEKITLIDGTVALSGGIDLCDDRWDSSAHLYHDRRRSLSGEKECHGPYHDMGIQVTGPICGHLQAHIAQRWRAISKIPFPEPALNKSSGMHPVYLSRTGVNRTGITREIEFLFKDLVHAAQSRIILEGQYYWSEVINDLLIAKMHEMQGRPFEIILVLAELKTVRSWTRYMAGFQLKLLKQLKNAAAYSGTKLLMGSPFVFRSGVRSGSSRYPKPIYIHSKTLVVDDRYLCIGSANFATRALRIDTELHLTFEARNAMERSNIRRVSERILEHWQDRMISMKLQIDIDQLPAPLKWMQLLPLQHLFDPVVPWFYRMSRRGVRR